MRAKQRFSIGRTACVATLCAVLASCSHTRAGTSQEPSTPSPSPQTPQPTMRVEVPAAVRPLLSELFADAARRSGVPAERLRIASAAAVTWPNGAIGCPRPGFGYTEALVRGWRVAIAVPSTTPQSSSSTTLLLYHGSDHGGWVHCPSDRATPPLPPSADPRV